MVVRALAVWLLIFALEVLHGVLRALWLVPLVGDLRSRQLGVLGGSLIILGVASLTIRWIGARGRCELLVVGLCWLVPMVGAELLLGRVAFGYPWSRIAEDRMRSGWRRRDHGRRATRPCGCRVARS